jgi:hypothetical protein
MIALLTLVKEELQNGEYKIEFITSPFLMNLFISIKGLSNKRRGWRINSN